MQEARSLNALHSVIAGWKEEGLSVGLVPTMGALHKGHLSLVGLALEKADRCVVSIFVNPTQFAPHEDFDAYPREETEDLEKLQNAGVHLVYLPSETDMYPGGMDTNITPGPAAEGLETNFRPHFFGGVINVVYRLFAQVKPDLAVFGEKDFQQLQVIREMVETENLPIEIIGGPIIRDEEGLALASRNAYLSEEELVTARQLNKILQETSSRLTPDLIRGHGGILSSGNGERSLDFARDDDSVLEKAKTRLLETGFDKIDYIDIRWNRILAAAWIGKTRLIDNVEVKQPCAL